MLLLVNVKQNKIYKQHNTCFHCQKRTKNTDLWVISNNAILEDFHRNKQISSIENLTLHIKRRNSQSRIKFLFNLIETILNSYKQNEGFPYLFPTLGKK